MSFRSIPRAILRDIAYLFNPALWWRQHVQDLDSNGVIIGRLNRLFARVVLHCIVITGVLNFVWTLCMWRHPISLFCFRWQIEELAIILASMCIAYLLMRSYLLLSSRFFAILIGDQGHPQRKAVFFCFVYHLFLGNLLCFFLGRVVIETILVLIGSPVRWLMNLSMDIHYIFYPATILTFVLLLGLAPLFFIRGYRMIAQALHISMKRSFLICLSSHLLTMCALMLIAHIFFLCTVVASFLYTVATK